MKTFEQLPRTQRKISLKQEAALRRTGDWGDWTHQNVAPGTVADRGWATGVTTVHWNRVFSVLSRFVDPLTIGVRHLAVSSLSGIRPSWHEMQRIKDDIAGASRTAVEVYPPKEEIVDGADMFHIWVLPDALPFSLYWKDK